MNKEKPTEISQRSSERTAEPSPWMEWALWLGLCALVTFFYLGAVVSAETLYQSVRPDASSAFCAIHPEVNPGGSLFQDVAKILVTLADTSWKAALIYGLLGFLPTLLFWGLVRPKNLFVKILSLFPLCVTVSLVQMSWINVVGFAAVWIGILAIALLLKPLLGGCEKGNGVHKWVERVVASLTILCLACGILEVRVWGMGFLFNYLEEWTIGLISFFFLYQYWVGKEGNQKSFNYKKGLLAALFIIFFGLFFWKIAGNTEDVFRGLSYEVPWKFQLYTVLCLVVLPLCTLGALGVQRIHFTKKTEQIVSGILVLVMFVGVGYTFLESRAQRNEALILSQVRQGHYVKALARASTLERMNPNLACTVRYALYKQNQLLENLFLFPLSQENAILPETPFEALEPYYKTMLEMGFINSAEHFATEALEQRGDAPELLYDLGIIYTLKGMPEAARLYWGYLSKNPLWRSRALELIAESRLHPEMREVPLLQPYYEFLFTDNYFSTKDPAEFQMRQSLKKNPAHRMALEYLAAEYLGFKNDEGIAGLLPSFRALNYTRLPRHIQEALCLILQDKPSLELAGYEVSPEIQARFGRFCQLYQKEEKSSPERLFQTMGPLFGDTYWFYQLFSVTGKLKVSKEEAE